MKTKPNTTQFKPTKDPSAFLDSGTADLAAREAQQQPVSSRVHREQKIFRLPMDLINTLKREAYERSMRTGERVTETELVEQALRAFFGPK